MLGRRGDLRAADLSERQVAECAVAVPAFEAVLAEEPLGPGARVELLLREPVDPREPVTRLPSPLGVEEMVRECSGVALGEAERQQALLSCVRLPAAGTS